MGTLVSDSQTFELRFRLYRVSQETKPKWITVEFAPKVRGQGKRSTVYTLTDSDVTQFMTSLSQLITGKRRRAIMTNMDEDLIIVVYPEERVEDKYVVELWYGEPFVLMHGYRFIVVKNSMTAFVQDLKDEKERLLIAHARGEV